MDKILEVRNISKRYRRGGQAVPAVNNVSFFLNRGEILGIMGPSGCGKSTLVNIITRLLDADEGEILLDGNPVTRLSGRQLRDIYKKVQMVFQSPADSFNPRKTIGSSVAESLINNGMDKKAALAEGGLLLSQCGLPIEYRNRFPHQLSGGECQRAAIARALAIRPKILICDEATSSLDVTIQKQILTLLQQLKVEYDMSYLVISHDPALIRYFCDRVIVMDGGCITEERYIEKKSWTHTAKGEVYGYKNYFGAGQVR